MKRMRRCTAMLLALAALLLLLCVPALADAPAGYVTVSFEDNGVRTGVAADFPNPLGTMIPAARVPFYAGENIAQVTLRLLDEQGMTWLNTGSADSNFYLSSIGGFYSSVAGGNVASFGEFSAGKDSGWMVTLNNWFINKGASEFPVGDGDVIRWRYTCQLGADIGCDWSVQSAKITGVAIDSGYGALSPAFSDSVRNYVLSVPSGVGSVRLEALLENYWSVVTYSSGGVTYKPLAAIPVENGAVITIDSGWAAEAGKPYTDTDRVTLTVSQMDDPLGGYSLGDATGDGSINSRDVIAIQKHIVGGELLGETAKARADVNRDGYVNSRDIVLIQKYIVGAITDF